VPKVTAFVKLAELKKGELSLSLSPVAWHDYLTESFDRSIVLGVDTYKLFTQLSHHRSGDEP
jgi:hypothetical protein